MQNGGRVLGNCSCSRSLITFPSKGDDFGWWCFVFVGSDSLWEGRNGPCHLGIRQNWKHHTLNLLSSWSLLFTTIFYFIFYFYFYFLSNFKFESQLLGYSRCFTTSFLSGYLSSQISLVWIVSVTMSSSSPVGLRSTSFFGLMVSSQLHHQWGLCRLDSFYYCLHLALYSGSLPPSVVIWQSQIDRSCRDAHLKSLPFGGEISNSEPHLEWLH